MSEVDHLRKQLARGILSDDPCQDSLPPPERFPEPSRDQSGTDSNGTDSAGTGGNGAAEQSSSMSSPSRLVNPSDVAEDFDSTVQQRSRANKAVSPSASPSTRDTFMDGFRDWTSRLSVHFIPASSDDGPGEGGVRSEQRRSHLEPMEGMDYDMGSSNLNADGDDDKLE